MLGVEGYGSDSDNDDDVQQQPSTSMAPPTKAVSSSLTSKLPPAKKSGLSLPPPSASTSAAVSRSTAKSSSVLSLPSPKKKAPKKITIGLPSLPPTEDEDNDEDRPPAKKARLEAGAGASALLSMLPAPKNKNPIPAQPERVLGSGRGPGLVFHTQRSTQQASVEDAEDAEEDSGPANTAPISNSILEEATETKQTSTASSLPFLPPSLAKGKANISTEEKFTLPKSAAVRSPAPAVDFFSLGSSSSSSSTQLLATSASSLPSTSNISSAPKVEDFTPPEPTPQDPYPGYYLLPSGSWAAYDSAYYQKFYNKWKKEYDAHVRALEKGVEKGFEAIEKEGAHEVNAQAEMERARVEIQEREEKKALTQGGDEERAAPKMNIKGAALSGRARGRHQLTTLLTEAYANREALEEKIAQGRRNRKEAGNKYGF